MTQLNRFKTAFVILSLLFVCYLAPAQQLPHTFSWLGNSFGTGKGSTTGKWVQNNIAGMHVTQDGRVYTASKWDEAKREGGIYKNGDVIGRLANLHPREGGNYPWHVAGDNYYIYVANGDKVRRYKFDGSIATFNGGIDRGGSLLVAANAERIFGVEADAAAGRLYASVPALNKVYRVNTNNNSMSVLSSFNFTRPGRIAVAPDGSLWIIQSKTSWQGGKILHYTATGTKLSQEISIGINFDPVDVCFDNNGRLLVADNGPDQQIKIYKNLDRSSPTLVSRLGANGGIFSGTKGKVAPLKFNGLTGVGVDQNGNIYVSQNRFGPQQNSAAGAGSILEAYKPDGTRLWKLVSLEFVDAVAIDTESDATTVYTKYSRYSMDYSKIGSGKEWTYQAHTMDPFTYPLDPRYRNRDSNFDFYTAGLIRKLGGKKFMVMNSMFANRFQIYKFKGEIAVPAVEFGQGGSSQPNSPSNTTNWVWRDNNDNALYEASEYATGGSWNADAVAWWMDKRGDVWQSFFSGSTPKTIRKFPFRGLDSKGNPKYSFSSMVDYGTLGGWKRIMRVIYQVDEDALYVSGYTRHLSLNEINSKKIGEVVKKYNNWSAGNRSATMILNIPDLDDVPSSIVVEGGYIFITYESGEGATDSGFINIFNKTNASKVGTITPPYNSNGRIDISYGLSVHRRSNGEYVIFLEDDWHAKIAVFRWKPGSSTLTAAASANPEATVSDETLTLYPNPTSERVAINLSSNTTEDLHYSVADVYGFTVGSGVLHLQKGKGTIDFSSYREGVYAVKVQSKNGVLFTKKVLKR